MGKIKKEAKEKLEDYDYDVKNLKKNFISMEE